MAGAPSSSSQVTSERRGVTAILRFANPPDGYIGNKAAAELLANLQALLADDAVRGVVITGGQPGVFIRHADVAVIGRAADALVSGRSQPSDFPPSPFPMLGRLLDSAEKPVIAAIDGACMGGGFEIALGCCARIAGPNATSIGLPEIRIGIFPGNGTQRLSRLIGRHRARLFMLGGTVVDAAKALELGLVDEVTTSVLERAVALSHAYALRPAKAVAAILRLTRPPADHLDEEQIAFAELIRDDASVRTRMQQFVERRERLDEID